MKKFLIGSLALFGCGPGVVLLYMGLFDHPATEVQGSSALILAVLSALIIGIDKGLE